MTRDVRKTPTMVVISIIRPGTKYQVLEWASLNHMRFSTVTMPRGAWPAMRAALKAATPASTYPLMEVAVAWSVP